jgi:hypothetical protein
MHLDPSQACLLVAVFGGLLVVVILTLLGINPRARSSFDKDDRHF